MSKVNTITMNYQEYKSYIKVNKNSRLADRSYSMALGGEQNREKILGSSIYMDTCTNTRYEWKAEYNDDFTSDEPLIKVTVDGADGKSQEFVINIDEVDTNAASDLEMFALCSYVDMHERRTESGTSSWGLLKAYVNDKLPESSLGQTGLDVLGEFAQKRDWLAMVGEEKETCMEAKLYKQVADGNQLTHLLEKYGMPKEVEMVRISEDTLIPVNNGISVRDVDGGYAQIQFGNNGEISYVNHLNSKADWTMEVSQEMLKKARELGSEFGSYMSDRAFWESYLNGDISMDELKAATDYKAIRTDFFGALPEPVKQVWEKAATEAGTDGLGIGENGELLYPSEFVKQYMLAKLKGENTKFYGNMEEGILEFAKRTLSKLQDAHQPKYNADLQRLKDKEILFYQNLVSNLA